MDVGTPSTGKPWVGTSAWDWGLDLTSLLPQQRKMSPGAVVPSLAPPPPGMLLLQHRCQRRAQVCVHRSQRFPFSLCLALWGNYALSSAQGLSLFPSLLVIPRASLDFPKKSPCPTALGCCPSLVPGAASQGKLAGRGEARG